MDLSTFPAPSLARKDGGRFIQHAGCCVVTKDFDSDWVNVGTYRVRVHDSNHVGLDVVPGKHGAIQSDKYMKAGKPFPVAIVCGADPLGYLISGIEVPFGMCECSYIGCDSARARVRVVEASSRGCLFPVLPRSFWRAGRPLPGTSGSRARSENFTVLSRQGRDCAGSDGRAHLLPE